MKTASTPMDIIAGMIAHAIKTSGEDKQALVVVLIVMGKVISEMPGNNSAVMNWVIESSARLSRVGRRD